MQEHNFWGVHLFVRIRHLGMLFTHALVWGKGTSDMDIIISLQTTHCEMGSHADGVLSPDRWHKVYLQLLFLIFY